MTDPASIEAAARALMTASEFGHKSDARKLARVVLAAVTPMIEAAALEKAAKLVEGTAEYGVSDYLATNIRALKEQP